MLFTGLCRAFFWIVGTIVAVFPQADTSWLSGISGHVRDAVGLMHRLDAYLPVTDLMLAVGLFMTVWLVISSVALVRKLVSLLSGGGGI